MRSQNISFMEFSYMYRCTWFRWNFSFGWRANVIRNARCITLFWWEYFQYFQHPFYHMRENDEKVNAFHSCVDVSEFECCWRRTNHLNSMTEWENGNSSGNGSSSSVEWGWTCEKINSEAETWIVVIQLKWL